jgi:spermidine synthase
VAGGSEHISLDVHGAPVTSIGPVRLLHTAPLVFASGVCALVYQTAWLREMRLVFGASTAASAAVLAIFMGGLGVGGLLIGRRADGHPRPLALYATLELAIAAVAAATPLLVWGVRELYVALGGSATLGLGGATVVRLLLAAVVLGPPAFLMGGTLPAMARAIETAGDDGRRRLAALYALNTLGAVLGAMMTTFLLLEVFGTRRTLWLASLVNAIVGLVARSAARQLAPLASVVEPDDAPSAEERAPSLVLPAAAIAGFAFFLMELVWYRMLGPLLGGSLFTFGLILAVALAGIGIGGLLYAVGRPGRGATYGGLALTCVLEAACLAVPYALGDRIAVLAMLLRPLAGVGFAGLVLGWTASTALVVLPASIVAGVQFPLLIALLGRGGTNVGRHVGRAYAWNTAGAITGSLAGGFGAMPLLSATGTWIGVTVLLLANGMAAAAFAIRAGSGIVASRVSIGLALVTTALLASATGPTAAWRHSPIGAGRGLSTSLLTGTTPNRLLDWIHARRREIIWSADGVESSVAIDASDGDAFVVNGKIDGNARGDAGTQVMLGLVPAVLHGAPARSLVIGLGTGSSAGWLGVVPTMDHVDVVELEPAILEVARLAAPVNQHVLENPRVRVIIGDAREVLFTTRERYDVVASEPSNPYRAGVSSLFTEEFYGAVAARLAPGGVFAQWVQAYEVDATTIHTIYATLGAVFPHVETWRTGYDDLLLVASMTPIAHDLAAVRRRIAMEPYRSALSNAWRADDLEGFYAHYVASPALARTIAERTDVARNTDDQTPIEFGFARSIGRKAGFQLDDLSAVARARGEARLPTTNGALDWTLVDRHGVSQLAAVGMSPSPRADLGPEQRRHADAVRAYAANDLPAVRQLSQDVSTASSMELVMRAEALAAAGDAAALEPIERLRALHPIEADALTARLMARTGRLPEAAAMLVGVFERLRTDPWPLPLLVKHTISVAVDVVMAAPAEGPRLFDALGTPFALHVAQTERLAARMLMLARLDVRSFCRPAFGAYEPHPPWDRDFLIARLRCYEATQDSLAPRAERDLEAYLAAEPAPFAHGLATP